jgi:hypothetical protein
VTTTALPPQDQGRSAMGIRLAGLLVVPPVVWALARWNVLPPMKLCIFQIVTGRPCPGCGMTRSILGLARGDVAASLRMHPLGVVLAGLYFATTAATSVGFVRGGDPVARFMERRGIQLVVALVVLFVLQWIVRGFVVPAWAPDPVGG